MSRVNCSLWRLDHQQEGASMKYSIHHSAWYSLRTGQMAVTSTSKVKACSDHGDCDVSPISVLARGAGGYLKTNSVAQELTIGAES
jgi:hypothetical protein